MLPKLRLHASVEQSISDLRYAETAVANLSGAGHRGFDLLNAYFNWASDAARVLRNTLTEHEVERLVYTRRYWALQASTEAVVSVLPSLVLDEAKAREEALRATLSALEATRQRWAVGTLVVADTSALIHGPKLQGLDASAVLQIDGPVHLLIPLVVLDELDALKESTKEHTRGRSRRTLKWLADEATDDVIANPRTGMTVHLLPEDPNHVRLPDVDSEVVDQAATIQTITARPVTLYTNDVSQAFRARRSGLATATVTEPVYDVDIKKAEHEANRQAKQDRRQRPSTSRE